MSFSVSLTSMCGHPVARSKKRSVAPKDARSKPRKTSSNRRFISLCRVRKGLASSRLRTFTWFPRLQGIRSLIAMLSSFRHAPATQRAAAPRVRLEQVSCSGRLLVLDPLVVVAAVDCDPARLHCLRDLTHELDLQEAAFEGSALHLHIIGQVEHPTERPGRDALIEVLMIMLVGLAPLDGEHILICGDGHLVG